MRTSRSIEDGPLDPPWDTYRPIRPADIERAYQEKQEALLEDVDYIHGALEQIARAPSVQRALKGLMKRHPLTPCECHLYDALTEQAAADAREAIDEELRA